MLLSLFCISVPTYIRTQGFPNKSDWYLCPWILINKRFCIREIYLVPFTTTRIGSSTADIGNVNKNVTINANVKFLQFFSFQFPLHMCYLHESLFYSYSFSKKCLISFIFWPFSSISYMYTPSMSQIAITIPLLSGFTQ